MVIVNIKKEDSKKAFKKEAVFKVPKIKGYPTIRIEKGCDFQRNTNFSYSSQPLFHAVCFRVKNISAFTGKKFNERIVGLYFDQFLYDGHILELFQ